VIFTLSNPTGALIMPLEHFSQLNANRTQSLGSSFDTFLIIKELSFNWHLR
jgi:hypothetical protein